MKRTTLLILSLVSFCAVNAQNKYKQYTDNLPFKMAEVQEQYLKGVNLYKL